FVWERPPRGEINVVSAANFLDWRDQNRVFEQMAAQSGASFNLSGTDRPQELQGWRVSTAYFNLLGVTTALGRTFTREEEDPGRDHVVVLSHRIWQQRFGADPGLIGRMISLNGESYQVVGVLQPGSNFDRGYAEIWVPLSFKPEQITRDFHFLSIIARLKPEVSLAQARTEMDRIGRDIEARYPKSNQGWGVTVEPMQDRVVGTETRRMLLTLLCAVGFILLIACANVANLTLAQGAARHKEIAIRAALGASWWRLMRQFLTESLLLSICGGVGGLVLGSALVKLLTALIPRFVLPIDNQVTLDYRVLLFTLGLALLTGIICGAIPAWQSARPDLNETLKEGGRSNTLSPGRHRLRSLLAISEVSLALMLLVGAGLLIRSFWSLQHVEPGFEVDHVLTMRLSLPMTRYREPAQMTAFFQEAERGIQALPGVRGVSLVQSLPLSGWGFGMPFTIEGQPAPDPAARSAAHFQMVSPTYFSVMKIPLLKGRSFTEQDRSGGAAVAIINQTMANRFFNNQDPLGKRLLIEALVPGRNELGAAVPWEIVGIIGNVKESSLEAEGASEIYVPFSQSPQPNSALVVRTTGEPTQLTGAVQQAIGAVDKDQPVTEIKSMEQVLAQSLAGRRFSTQLLIAFAAIAMVLAAVGIYGVISYSVAQRTHEIGIRMALGAGSGEVFKLILKQALKLASIGVVIGLIGAFALTRLISGLLFGISAADPATFGLISILIVGVASAASYFPARRAMKVDPIVALRVE
ncbi:MAG TPA: ABC transporter permease, partial [Blastocatellia bacterium]|nr:ABC transporter permease [Blastocatellia bacterium]